MTGIGADERPAIVNGVDVDTLAATVRSCHFVSDLAAGGPGSPATYLPGRRVAGIAVDDERVRIQVRSCWAAPADVVATEIRASVRPLVGDRRIDITIADIDDPPGAWPSSGDVPRPTHKGRATSSPRLEPRGSDVAPPRIDLPPAS